MSTTTLAHGSSATGCAGSLSDCEHNRAKHNSGRKPARTDYVYLVAVHSGAYATVFDTTRTLKAARDSARSFDGAPNRDSFRFRKIGRSNWISSPDKVATYAIGVETFYTIQRHPLHN